MAIKYFNDGCGYRLPAKRRTAVWLGACARNEGYRLGPVDYIFCSPERHLEINRRYLGHDYYTDVITFDYNDLQWQGRVSGDIFIDPETVVDNASLFGADALTEMRRVMVHGLLHLCGYCDKMPEEEKTMRSKEDFYLARFDKTD